MRLWTLHPKYLDPQGLVALWREALLARAVLRGETRGYKHHPQLERFRSHDEPAAAIGAYLGAVFDEAASRGYSFDAGKVAGAGAAGAATPIAAKSGQIEFEWQHLLGKLSNRSPALFERWRKTIAPEPHPIFLIVPGGLESWERSRKQDDRASTTVATDRVNIRVYPTITIISLPTCYSKTVLI